MQVHRCRFVEWQPAAISALAFAPISGSLAVARDNGDIELWTVTSAPAHCYLRIPGRSDFSVKALAWAVHEESTSVDEEESDSSDEEKKQPAKRQCKQATRTRKERLFSAGTSIHLTPGAYFTIALNGQITEWDLATLRPRISSDSYGGGVWSLACNSAGSLLAAACEDGSIRLFNIANDALGYARALPTQPKRVCSVAFHAEGVELVAGYADGCIRRWNCRTGTTTYRITIEAEDRHLMGTAPVIWAVLVLSDWTIISGDSLGKTRVWDGRFGTLLHSFEQHTADVLCLAKNKAENKVYSAGIDAKVAQFQLLLEGDGKRWTHTHSQRAHTHDVQALACTGSTLVSGGLDTQLEVYSTADFDTRQPRRVLPFPHRPAVHSSPSTPLPASPSPSRFILCTSDHSLEVSRYGVESYAPVLRLNLHGPHNLLTVALAPNAMFAAASDINQLRIFHLDLAARPARASAITSTALANVAAHALCFSSDSKSLCAASLDGDVLVFDLSKSEPTLTHTLSHTRASIQQRVKITNSPICSVAMSADGRFVASGDISSAVHVFDLRNNGRHHASLAVSSQRLRSLSFHPSQNLLVVLYANNSFALYDADAKRLSDWSREYGAHLPANNALLARKEPLLGVTWNPVRASSLLFWGEAFLCFVDLDQPVTGKQERDRVEQEKLERKKARQNKLDWKELREANKEKEKKEQKEKDARKRKQRSAEPANFDCVTKYRPILHAAFVASNELVVVERPWVRVAQSFPEALHRHKYRSGS